MLSATVPVPESEPAGTKEGVVQLNLAFTGNDVVGAKVGAEPLQTDNVSDARVRTGVGLTVTTRSNGEKETQEPALAYTLYVAV